MATMTAAELQRELKAMELTRALMRLTPAQLHEFLHSPEVTALIGDELREALQDLQAIG